MQYRQKNTQCSGQGEIQFWRYEDSRGCGENGCDFHFKNVLIEDEDGNELHKINKTEHIREDHENKNVIYFPKFPGLDEVFRVQIPTKKRISISFEVWDKDYSGADTDKHERTWKKLKVHFAESVVADGWGFYSYTQGTKGEAKFTYKFRLASCDTYFTGLGCNSCVINRYGEDCSKLCEPSPGFYTCSLDGQKICEERRQGVNCADCVQQFKGDDCEKCAENYYPEETCKVYCSPTLNRYICTDQGQKQCLQNRTGSDCEYCISNHYGEDCSKFCEETDSYTCDQSGGKICRQHFYPAAKCDIICEPVPGNFTCNQTTGQKICVDGKAGSYCDVREKRKKVGEKCKQFFFGPECTIYCKPEVGLHNCSENGTKVCLGNTAIAKNSCLRKNLSIPLIVGAGAGGLFFILVITGIILKVRRECRKETTKTVVDVSNVAEHSIGKEDCATYTNTRIEKIKGLTEVMNGKRSTDCTGKHDTYVEAPTIRKREDFVVYVKTEYPKRTGVCVRTPTNDSSENFGLYVEMECARKNPKNEVYVNTLMRRNEDSGINEEASVEEKDVYVDANLLRRKEDVGTYMNTGNVNTKQRYDAL